MRFATTVVALFGACTSASAAEKAKPSVVRYMVVTTGSELLNGVYADGHTHFLTRTLRPLGLRCVGSMSVDDKEKDLTEALRFAAGKAPLVIVTGGLGPTANDITRSTISGFTGVALKEHPEAVAALAARLRTSVDKLRPNLRRQTCVPVGGTYLKNPHGTAVGLVFDREASVIVALPGPPRELQPMVRDEVIPYLSRRFGTRLPGCSLTLRFLGVGQSHITATLDERVSMPGDVAVSSDFSDGRVDFTFSLPHDTPNDRARLSELKKQVMECLGEHIYAEGDTTLEECVVQQLHSAGATLAIAEVGSGGVLAEGLSNVPGVEKVLLGAFTAPSEEQLRRLLNVPDDEWQKSGSAIGTIAAAAAERATATCVVAVGQVTEPSGGTPGVEVAILLPGGKVFRQRVPLRGAGIDAKRRLSTQVLDLVRRRL